MKLILGLFGVLLLIVIVGTYSRNTLFPNGDFLNFSNSTPKATIDNQSFVLDVAKTEPEKEKGLSNKSSLASDHGMVFLFNPSQQVVFWMKGMEFPLDIIYINNNKIVEIDKNLQPPAKGTPDNEIETYPSNEPVDKVLEINAGLSDKFGFKTGDNVDFSNL